jgi:hypothetical protein
MNQWKVSTPHGDQTVEATDLAITGNSDLVFTLMGLVALAFPCGAWTGCELVTVNDATNQGRWLAQGWIESRAKAVPSFDKPWPQPLHVAREPNRAARP